MLTVIAIAGILAALAVPALKNLGKSNGAVGATQQLLNDVGRARQLAISQHTTVYMVFVPANFWVVRGSFPNIWWDKLTPAEKTAATNLCDKQLTGYTFVSLRSVGDQPGRGVAQYLAPWQNLPDGTFIAQWKFSSTVSSIVSPLVFHDPVDSSKTFTIYPFDYTNNIPFPTETSPVGVFSPSLPYIAFNYLGQLISGNDQDYAGSGEDIPLAQGSVSPAINAATKTFVLNSPPSVFPQVSEIPPGNSTNISYNIIHIDRLTGRATVENHKIK
jgi:type II secretory pathway pseudopilin PulG